MQEPFRERSSARATKTIAHMTRAQHRSAYNTQYNNIAYNENTAMHRLPFPLDAELMRKLQLGSSGETQRPIALVEWERATKAVHQSVFVIASYMLHSRLSHQLEIGFRWSCLCLCSAVQKAVSVLEVLARGKQKREFKEVFFSCLFFFSNLCNCCDSAEKQYESQFDRPECCKRIACITVKIVTRISEHPSGQLMPPIIRHSPSKIFWIWIIAMDTYKAIIWMGKFLFSKNFGAKCVQHRIIN